MFKTISIYTVSSCLVAAITTSAFAQGLEMETYTGKFLPSNSTILLTEDEALVIDAQFLRPDGEGLTAQVEATGRRLTAILITHEHPDHVFGAVELLKKFPEAKVYARSRLKRRSNYISARGCCGGRKIFQSICRPNCLK
jgi:glyoxylase-like metal-dependent hydrolase (beta-lactamase superfamily II)